MAQFSVKIMRLPGSLLGENQHDADGGEACVGGDQRDAVAITGLAPHGFALPQVATAPGSGSRDVVQQQILASLTGFGTLLNVDLILR
jgi:hypothetical protein